MPMEHPTLVAQAPAVKDGSPKRPELKCKRTFDQFYSDCRKMPLALSGQRQYADGHLPSPTRQYPMMEEAPRLHQNRAAATPEIANPKPARFVDIEQLLEKLEKEILEAEAKKAEAKEAEAMEATRRARIRATLRAPRDRTHQSCRPGNGCHCQRAQSPAQQPSNSGQPGTSSPHDQTRNPIPRYLRPSSSVDCQPSISGPHYQTRSPIPRYSGASSLENHSNDSSKYRDTRSSSPYYQPDSPGPQYSRAPSPVNQPNNSGQHNKPDAPRQSSRPKFPVWYYRESDPGPYRRSSNSRKCQNTNNSSPHYQPSSPDPQYSTGQHNKPDAPRQSRRSKFPEWYYQESDPGPYHRSGTSGRHHHPRTSGSNRRSRSPVSRPRDSRGKSPVCQPSCFGPEYLQAAHSQQSVYSARDHGPEYQPSASGQHYELS